MESESDTPVASGDRSTRNSDVCKEKMNKLRIKLGKDQSGKIVHGKIISEENEEGNNQSILLKTSVEEYQLPLNPDDCFHGFPDSSIPDWVSGDFTGVDLKSKFHIKPTLIASIYNKHHKNKRKQPNLQDNSVSSPVSVKASDPSVVESPNQVRECQFEVPDITMVAVPSQLQLSSKRMCTRERSEQFEIEVELKNAPVKYTTRRSRSEKTCHRSSNNPVSNSHIPDTETDMVHTDTEIPPLFLAASVNDWVEDEITLAAACPPHSQAGDSAQHGDDIANGFGYKVRKGGIGRTGLGSGRAGVRRQQSAIPRSTLNTPVSPPHPIPPSSPSPLQISPFASLSQPRQVSSDSNDNPDMEIGSEEEVSSSRASVIVKNPSQPTWFLKTSDQQLFKERDMSREVIDLTDATEEYFEVETKSSSSQAVVRQRKEGMSPTVVGSSSRNSYSGVEIHLVIPANNNHNTELKITLNQNQVEELKNCLKEV